VTVPKSFSKSICSFEDACQQRKKKLGNHTKIVLTNGCFDLLHSGHVHALEKASKLGDELWIALNSDSSVRSIKGPSRPIYSQSERSYILRSLRFVSLVFLFDHSDLSEEILKLRPDVYVKSGAYSLEALNKKEKDALDQVGAKICFVPFIKGFSTTSKIELIQNLKPEPS